MVSPSWLVIFFWLSRIFPFNTLAHILTVLGLPSCSFQQEQHHLQELSNCVVNSNPCCFSPANCIWRFLHKNEKNYHIWGLSFKHCTLGFPGNSISKESACNAGDLGSIPGSGRSPGEGNGNPLQYSCLENSLDEEPGGPQSMGHKELDMTEWLTFTFFHTLYRWPPCKIGIIFPALQIRKLGFGELKQCIQAHTVRKWQTQGGWW